MVFNRSQRDPSSPLPSPRGPGPLRPRTPDDGPDCRDAAAAPAAASPASGLPYAQLKSRRDRPKSIDTAGFACPHPDCPYFGITDPNGHALVGYGGHGQRTFIQDICGQACGRTVTSRRHTPLYRLKTASATVAQVLHAIAEGLRPCAAARVFPLREASVRMWLSRAGQHSYTLPDRLLRALQLSHVQRDELRLKLRGAAEVTWRWIACDARTRVRVIPAFVLGPRTPALAHHLVHPTPLRFGDYSELAKRLGLGGLPVFASDGLSLYF